MTHHSHQELPLAELTKQLGLSVPGTTMNNRLASELQRRQAESIFENTRYTLATVVVATVALAVAILALFK